MLLLEAEIRCGQRVLAVLLVGPRDGVVLDGVELVKLSVRISDPAIERCRSYRSAVEYLAELDRPLPPTVADGQARR